MFRAVLFVIKPKTGKSPNSIRREMNKHIEVYPYNRTWFVNTKNKLLECAATLVDLKIIILIERSQAYESTLPKIVYVVWFYSYETLEGIK